MTWRGSAKRSGTKSLLRCVQTWWPTTRNIWPLWLPTRVLPPSTKSCFAKGSNTYLTHYNANTFIIRNQKWESDQQVPTPTSGGDYTFNWGKPNKMPREVVRSLSHWHKQRIQDREAGRWMVEKDRGIRLTRKVQGLVVSAWSATKTHVATTGVKSIHIHYSGRSIDTRV